MAKRIGVLIAAALLLTAAGFGQGKGKGKGHGKGGGERGEPDRGAIVFSTHDLRIVQDHFAPGGNLPPGLAKRGGDLPPGLAKQLQRRGHLPPGLEKKIQPFPIELERRLAPLPPGYTRVTLGTQALILDAARVVVDIMDIARR